MTIWKATHIPWFLCKLSSSVLRDANQDCAKTLQSCKVFKNKVLKHIKFQSSKVVKNNAKLKVRKKNTTLEPRNRILHWRLSFPVKKPLQRKMIPWNFTKYKSLVRRIIKPVKPVKLLMEHCSKIVNSF